MYILSILLGSLGIAVVLKFIVSPFLYQRALLDKGITRSPKYALSSLIDFITFVLLLLSIALIISWLLLQYINSSGGSDLNQLKVFLANLRSIDSFLFYWASQTLIWSIILIITLLSVYSYKKGKKTSDKEIELALEKDLQRLQSDMLNDRWEDLPPTKSMHEASHLIDEYKEKVEEFKKEGEKENHEAILLLKENIETIKEYMQSLDIQRRLNIEVEDKGIVSKNKFLIFFMSKGLMNSLQRTSFIFFVIAILLFIPLFVSASSQYINDLIKNKIVQLDFKIEKLKVEDNLENLRVVNSDSIKKDEELTAEDENTLNELSITFENHFMRVRVLNTGKKSLNVAKELKAYSIKESILKQNAQRSEYLTVPKEEVSPVIRESVVLEERAILSDEPITELGKRIKEDLKNEIYLKDRKLWNHYKEVVKSSTNSFQKPLTPKNIKGLAISNLLGDFGDLIEPIYNIESSRYMVALGREKYMDDVLKSMNNINFKPLPKSLNIELKENLNKIINNDELKKVLIDNPPSLSAVSEKPIKIKDMNLLIHDLAKQTNTISTTHFADALASFDDYFPGKFALEQHTPMSSAMNYVDNEPTSSGGGGGSYSDSKNSKFKKSKARFGRARSYVKLKGFSRIGGVLIGRMPTKYSSELNIKNIEWYRTKNKLQISLVKNDNTKIDLGLFNPAIVNLALAYASDGRVTTATMVTAKPLSELKILLHPTLLDSGLGCQAIELDRIADMITSNNFLLSLQRRIRNEEITNYEKLYTYSWALRVQTIIENNSASKEVLKELDDYSQSIIDKTNKDLIKQKINFDFPKNKTAFFDKKLIDSINSCVNNKSFSTCIKNEGSNIIINSQSDFKKWIFPIPQDIKTIEWSGVREEEYNIDKEFDFLKLEKHDELWPLRFMVQRVFTTKPTFVDDPDKYVDKPWEYLDVNKILMKSIKDHIKKDYETKRIIDNMREFVILQRLFRLILDDKSNINFPLDNLLKLSKETLKDVNTNVRTLRWNPRIGSVEIELKSVLKEEIGKNDTAKANSSWIIKTKQCLSFLEDKSTANKILNITNKSWNNNCNFNTNGENIKLDKYLKYFNSLRKLKDRLGVFIDEKQLYKNQGRACPRVQISDDYNVPTNQHHIK